jgi:hypothetical protein
MSKHDGQYSSHDDKRAREAAENPLRTAAKREPPHVPGGLSWTGPLAVVAVAVVVLFVFVTVIL